MCSRAVADPGKGCDLRGDPLEGGRIRRLLDDDQSGLWFVVDRQYLKIMVAHARG